MINRAVHNRIRTVFAASVAAIFVLSGAARAQTLFQPLGAPNSKSITLAAGATPLGVASADFNHDGYPDLVVANFADTSLNTSGTISVYLSSGPGTFAAPTKYPTCGGPTAVLAQDLDLTGLQDIVITCNTPTSNVIQVFLNLGNGTFDPTMGNGTTNIVLGTGVGPVSIVSGDFNNDGHPDLAVANLDGSVTLFLSNAANNFTYYTVKPIPGVGNRLTGITDGYFSNSGNVDLAVTDSGRNKVHILIGDGTGNFSIGSSKAVGSKPTGIVAMDLNHDGRPDLAVANSASGTVSVLLGRGDGNFAGANYIRVGSADGTHASAIIAADIDGDGNPDLITANTRQNNFSLLLNNGDATFQTVQSYRLLNGPAYLATGDFNRDGKPDLAITQSTGSTVSVLMNNTRPTPVPGGRSFVAPHILKRGHGNMADGVAVADFDHDGFADLAVSYLQDNSVRVITGNSSGNFNNSGVYSVGKNPYWVATGDLNNDGYSDLVTANTGDDTVSVLMNSGGGSAMFGTAQNLHVGHLPYQVAIGDLNGDGFADLAVTDYGDNTVTILYGPFNTPFQIVQLLQTCTNPYGVAIGDFRHTGRQDIAITCFQTAQMEYFQNTTPGLPNPPPQQATFASPKIFTTSVNPTSLVIGDFNRDGNPDIVTGNSIANNVSFFAGDGAGNFANAVDSFALNFPDSIAAGDVNGDGILDIAAVAPNFNQVTILQGNGNGTFQPRMDFTTGTQPWAVALGDFNNDGKMDVVTANTFNRVNLTIPAYQQMYMKEFPPVAGGHPSVSVMLNNSGTTITATATPRGTVAPHTPITLTATVKATLGGTTPTGSVIFEDTDGTATAPIPLSNGTASTTVTTLTSGTHRATVLYSGDTLYQPNTFAGPTVRVR